MRFSRKQRKVLTWFYSKNRSDFSAKKGENGGGAGEKVGVICHGAVRSGKTLACGVGFILWAMCSFAGREFAICGKSRSAVRRNLLGQVSEALKSFGFRIEHRISENLFVVKFGKIQNTFRIFGGMNEASASLIQGCTLAGVLFDEVTLLPETFVQQAMARCSVSGAKYWFCCNPDSPGHWFKREFLDRADERRLEVVHFEMGDNPTLGREVLERYHLQFGGSFFRRFVLGLWEAPEGLVYDFMVDGRLADEPPREPLERYVVSVDYGTANPASFGLWGCKDGVWWRVDEFYYDGRKSGSLTDEEYVERLGRLVGERRVAAVIVDPSARSFIAALRKAGFRVRAAANAVADGIRRTASALKERRVRISPRCRAAWREFGLYRWRDGAGDEVVKENDHAMDEIRYFIATVGA